MKSYNRRRFLVRSSLAAGTAALAAGCGPVKTTPLTEAEKSAKTYTWRMVTTWPPHFPVLGEGADLLAKQIETMSGGRLKIQVYGGNELVPPLEVFDAVSSGSAHMGHGAAYYWAGKASAAPFFTTIPFGMNAQQMNAWLLSGGGLKLWEEYYDPLNLIPFPCGNTGVQMGGWFNKEINSVADMKGLKMRIPGLGGQVISKAGSSAILVAAAEIYTSLERGVIDAAEWIGPYHDYKLGLHKVAKYYYYPGWHETGSTLELIVNKDAFNSLPADLQEIVRTAAYRANMWMLSEFEAQNNFYLGKLLDEEKVQLRQFPPDVMMALKQYSKEVIEAMAAADPRTSKIYEHVQAFKKNIINWNKVSENAIGPYLS
jgi:TRAP-type mannitol/chloroaromatic compound transport system substrate-binding protein